MLAWLFGNWLANRRTLLLRVTSNALIADLLAQFIRLGIGVVGLVLGLSLLDATPVIDTLLGAAGIIGLAVGVAVRDRVENTSRAFCSRCGVRSDRTNTSIATASPGVSRV